MAGANNSSSGKEPNAVLLVTDQYATSKEDDVSTMNRQVVQILTGAGRKVYCLVLEDTEEDRKCAEADGVELILPSCSQEDKRKPCLDWLTFDHLNRYPRLPKDIGWIVGHADVTSRAAATIMEERFPLANLSLVTQTIPEDTEKYKEEKKAMGIGKKEDSIRQDAEKAKTVFSVGHRTHDHFTNIIRAISKDKRPVHKLFLPEPSKIFQETTVEYVESREKVVLLISRVKEVGKLKGLDFVAKSLARVAKRSNERIQLRIRGVSEEEYQASMKILQTSIKSGKLKPTLLPHGTQEDICRDMQQAHLVLMPSRTEPFGLVGLEAMAAGVPVLISDQSGLATLVKEVIPEFHHSVLAITGDDSIDVRQWADQIENILKMSKAEFSRAAALKQKLLESRYWEESHQCFLQACGEDTVAHQPIQVMKRKRDTDLTDEREDSGRAKKKDLSGLGQLWFMYNSRKLNDLMYGSLIRRETLKQLCAESVSVKTTINIEDFRKALVYLLTTSSAEGQPIPRQPQEYPLYQPHPHTTASVLDVLHLDGTNLTRSSGKQQELHIPTATQTEDSGNLQAAGVQHIPQPSIDVQVEQVTSQLASLDSSWQPDVDTQKLQSGSMWGGQQSAVLDTTPPASPVLRSHTQEQGMIPQCAGYEIDLTIAGTSLLINGQGNGGHSRKEQCHPRLIPVIVRVMGNAGPNLAPSALASRSLVPPFKILATVMLTSFTVRLPIFGRSTRGQVGTCGDKDDPQASLNALHIQLNTPAVKRDQAQQFDLYCQIGDLYRTKLQNLQSALQYYQNMLQCSQELSEDTKQAKAYSRLGLAYALAVAMDTGNKNEQMDIYCKLGDLHRKQLHEPQESHKYYTEMLALARDLGRKDMESQAYNRLGLAHYDMGEHEESLEWYKRDLKISQESDAKTGQITAHQNIADSYKALGKLDLARSHYQSAMTIAMETGNKTEQMDIYCKLGDLHWEQLHELEESDKYYTGMLALARDLGRKEEESQAYKRLGQTGDRAGTGVLVVGPRWHEFGSGAGMTRVWQLSQGHEFGVLAEKTRDWRVSREVTSLAFEPRSHEFGV
ncbi:hypothetical protein Bbelb_022510 [Branchiostoma belcheri]|nr:hypothetical protein Bbelb_022510 [Branchiostoma belcheri]